MFVYLKNIYRMRLQLLLPLRGRLTTIFFTFFKSLKLATAKTFLSSDANSLNDSSLTFLPMPMTYISTSSSFLSTSAAFLGEPPTFDSPSVTRKSALVLPGRLAEGRIRFRTISKASLVAVAPPD